MAYVNPFVPTLAQSIISIQAESVSSGVYTWYAGRTYTVKWYFHEWHVYPNGSISDYYLYKIAPMMPISDYPDALGGYRRVANPIFSSESNADSYGLVGSTHQWTGHENGSGTYLDWDDYTSLVNNQITQTEMTMDWASNDGGTGAHDSTYYRVPVTSTFTVSTDATHGTYTLCYMGNHDYSTPNPDTLSETAREYISIIISSSGGSIEVTDEWPPERTIDYDDDKEWDEDAQAWVQGGRYQHQLIAIGEHGEIYYSTIT